jgi:spore maturation protein CgeB
LKLAVFGLSITCSWGNGHATTYRSLLRAFAERGHEVVFFEWDAPWYRGDRRDLLEPSFLRLVLYPEWSEIRRPAIAEALDADATIVGSYVDRGAEVIDDLAAAGVDPLFFYDIDTPVTVAGLRSETAAYLRRDQVPVFTRYLSFTGGPFLDRVIVGEFGARAANPLYCSVDLERYRSVPAEPEFDVDLAYMGTYAADRQPVVSRFLFEVARRLPDRRFLVAGSQYPGDLDWPPNVRHLEHLPPARHPAFYSSARWQLNATRADMVAAGWSPSVRIFEAGAVGASIVSDGWPGIEHLFRPGHELCLPGSTEDVVDLVSRTPDEERRAIGASLRERIAAEHSSQVRAEQLERLVSTAPAIRWDGSTSSLDGYRMLGTKGIESEP